MKLETVFEIVKIKQVTTERLVTVRSPKDAGIFLQDEIGDYANEVLYVLCFDTKMRIVALHKVSEGALNSAIVHPREIFKSAILNNAGSIIIAHNHPSYCEKPSQEDLEITQRIASAGQILGIELLDHLIVTPERHYSIKEKHSHLFD
jgi:DNA repair protein RadC